MNIWYQPAWRYVTKITVLLVSFCFLFPFLIWAFEPATFQNPHALKLGTVPLEIPEQLGSILESRPGQSPVIVHVRDLHCNYEVQSRIQGIIEYLAERHGLRLVAIEGAGKPVNVTKLSSFPDQQIKAAVGEQFVRQGKISGAELYAATGKYPVELVGIEHAERYAEEAACVQRFLTDENQGWIYDLREALNYTKASVYGPRLLKFDAHRQAYQNGEVLPLAFASFLVRSARAQNFDLAAYPHLKRYVSRRIQPLPIQVDSDALLEEIDTLELQLRARLIRTPEERELSGLEQRVDLMEKLINISASPEELARYREAPEKYRAREVLRYLYQQGEAEALGLDAEVLQLDQALSEVHTFYQLADLRSQDFVHNLSGLLETREVDIALLVTGGYHTREILAALREQGLGYVSVKPRLTQLDQVNPYFSLLKKQATPLEKLLAQNQRLMALAPFFAQGADRAAILDEAILPVDIRIGYLVLDMTLKLRWLNQRLQRDLPDMAALRLDYARLIDEYRANNPQVDLALEDIRANQDGLLVSFRGSPVFALIYPDHKERRLPGLPLHRTLLNGYVVSFYDQSEYISVAKLFPDSLESARQTSPGWREQVQSFTASLRPGLSQLARQNTRAQETMALLWGALRARFKSMPWAWGALAVAAGLAFFLPADSEPLVRAIGPFAMFGMVSDPGNPFARFRRPFPKTWLREEALAAALADLVGEGYEVTSKEWKKHNRVVEIQLRKGAETRIVFAKYQAYRAMDLGLKVQELIGLPGFRMTELGAGHVLMSDAGLPNFEAGPLVRQLVNAAGQLPERERVLETFFNQLSYQIGLVMASEVVLGYEDGSSDNIVLNDFRALAPLVASRDYYAGFRRLEALVRQGVRLTHIDFETDMLLADDAVAFDTQRFKEIKHGTFSLYSQFGDWVNPELVKTGFDAGMIAARSQLSQIENTLSDYSELVGDVPKVLQALKMRLLPSRHNAWYAALTDGTRLAPRADRESPGGKQKGASALGFIFFLGGVALTLAGLAQTAIVGLSLVSGGLVAFGLTGALLTLLAFPAARLRLSGAARRFLQPARVQSWISFSVLPSLRGWGRQYTAALRQYTGNIRVSPRRAAVLLAAVVAGIILSAWFWPQGSLNLENGILLSGAVLGIAGTEPPRRSLFFHAGLAAPGDAEFRQRTYGAKAANLVEMLLLGLPVPPGFALPADLSLKKNLARQVNLHQNEVSDNLSLLENETSQVFGDPSNPLLVSVRSGAVSSMPGMLLTLTNVGLNDQTVEGLATRTGNRAYALATYAEYIVDYALGVSAVSGEDAEYFRQEREALIQTRADRLLTEAEYAERIARYQGRLRTAGLVFPQNAREQLDQSMRAVMASWESPRARQYRQRQGLEDAGTGVIVQQMVGHGSRASGSGVLTSRDLITGERRLTGEFNFNLPGTAVAGGQMVSGTLEELRTAQPEVYRTLEAQVARLEQHFQGDIQDVEFTLENGQLYFLQTRSAEGIIYPLARVRSLQAAIQAGLKQEAEVVSQVSEQEMQWIEDALLAPKVPDGVAGLIGTGRPAAPGLRSGVVALSLDAAREFMSQDLPVILVRDRSGFADEAVLAQDLCHGVIERVGGVFSHASGVFRAQRQMKPCVLGVEEMSLDTTQTPVALIIGDTRIAEGQPLTVDGTTGRIFAGESVYTEPSPTKQALAGDYGARASLEFQLYQTVQRWRQRIKEMAWQDEQRLAELHFSLTMTKLPEALGAMDQSQVSEVIRWLREQRPELLTDAYRPILVAMSMMKSFPERIPEFKFRYDSAATSAMGYIGMVLSSLRTSENRALFFSLMRDFEPNLLRRLLYNPYMYHHMITPSFVHMGRQAPAELAAILDEYAINTGSLNYSERDNYQGTMEFIFSRPLAQLSQDEAADVLDRVEGHTLAYLASDWLAGIEANLEKLEYLAEPDVGALFNRVLAEWEAESPGKAARFWQVVRETDELQAAPWPYRNREAWLSNHLRGQGVMTRTVPSEEFSSQRARMRATEQEIGQLLKEMQAGYEVERMLAALRERYQVPQWIASTGRQDLAAQAEQYSRLISQLRNTLTRATDKPLYMHPAILANLLLLPEFETRYGTDTGLLWEMQEAFLRTLPENEAEVAALRERYPAIPAPDLALLSWAVGTDHFYLNTVRQHVYEDLKPDPAGLAPLLQYITLAARRGIGFEQRGHVFNHLFQILANGLIPETLVKWKQTLEMLSWVTHIDQVQESVSRTGRLDSQEGFQASLAKGLERLGVGAGRIENIRLTKELVAEISVRVPGGLRLYYLKRDVYPATVLGNALQGFAGVSGVHVVPVLGQHALQEDAGMTLRESQAWLQALDQQADTIPGGREIWNRFFQQVSLQAGHLLAGQVLMNLSDSHDRNMVLQGVRGLAALAQQGDWEGAFQVLADVVEGQTLRLTNIDFGQGLMLRDTSPNYLRQNTRYLRYNLGRWLDQEQVQKGFQAGLAGAWQKIPSIERMLRAQRDLGLSLPGTALEELTRRIQPGRSESWLEFLFGTSEQFAEPESRPAARTALDFRWINPAELTPVLEKMAGPDFRLEQVRWRGVHVAEITVTTALGQPLVYFIKENAIHETQLGNDLQQVAGIPGFTVEKVGTRHALMSRAGVPVWWAGLALNRMMGHAQNANDARQLNVLAQCLRQLNEQAGRLLASHVILGYTDGHDENLVILNFERIAALTWMNEYDAALDQLEIFVNGAGIQLTSVDFSPTRMLGRHVPSIYVKKSGETLTKTFRPWLNLDLWRSGFRAGLAEARSNITRIRELIITDDPRTETTFASVETRINEQNEDQWFTTLTEYTDREQDERGFKQIADAARRTGRSAGFGRIEVLTGISVISLLVLVGLVIAGTIPATLGQTDRLMILGGWLAGGIGMPLLAGVGISGLINNKVKEVSGVDWVIEERRAQAVNNPEAEYNQSEPVVGINLNKPSLDFFAPPFNRDEPLSAYAFVELTRLLGQNIQLNQLDTVAINFSDDPDFVRDYVLYMASKRPAMVLETMPRLSYHWQRNVDRAFLVQVLITALNKIPAEDIPATLERISEEWKVIGWTPQRWGELPAKLAAAISPQRNADAYGVSDWGALWDPENASSLSKFFGDLEQNPDWINRIAWPDKTGSGVWSRIRAGLANLGTHPVMHVTAREGGRALLTLLVLMPPVLLFAAAGTLGIVTGVWVGLPVIFAAAGGVTLLVAFFYAFYLPFRARQRALRPPESEEAASVSRVRPQVFLTTFIALAFSIGAIGLAISTGTWLGPAAVFAALALVTFGGGVWLFIFPASRPAPKRVSAQALDKSSRTGKNEPETTTARKPTRGTDRESGFIRQEALGFLAGLSGVAILILGVAGLAASGPAVLAGSLVSAGAVLLISAAYLFGLLPARRMTPVPALAPVSRSVSDSGVKAWFAQNRDLGLDRANQPFTFGLTRRVRQAQTLIYSMLVPAEAVHAGNWRQRLPWEGMHTLLRSGLMFLRGLSSAWFGRSSGTAFDFDPDQTDLKALMRQHFLPDTATALAFARRFGLSVKPVQVLPSSRLQRGGFFLRSAYREQSATGEPTVYLPDAMLARLAQIPEQGRTVRARLSRWSWLANRYFLGLMIRQQGARYYADQRLRSAKHRPAISDLDEFETSAIADQTTGELVTQFYGDGRGKKGLSVYDILSLFETYWQEGQQVLVGSDQIADTLSDTFAQARRHGAEPTLPALATHLEQMSESEAGNQGPLQVKRAVMIESRLLERDLRRQITQDTLASVINRQTPGREQVERAPESGVVDTTTEITVLNMPVAYASMLERLRQMESQLRKANAPGGLLARIRILQQALEEIQTAPAGTLAPLSPVVGQRLWGESARQARLEQNQALTLGEDLDRQRLGATNRRAEVTTLQGVPLAFRQVFEITSPEEQSAILAWQQETALPDRAAARRYSGNRLRTITDVRTGLPLWLRAAAILSRMLPQPLSGRLQRRLQQARPLGMLQLVLVRLPASPVKDLLADAQSPLGQAYLRWSAQPNRRTESRFIRSLVRILKAQRQELQRLEAESTRLENSRAAHVASLAAFMEMTRGLRSLQGVAVGSWDQVPVPGAKIRLMVPGILLRPGNLGVWGALSDILRDLPVTIDTDLFELQRRRLFRSATQAA